MQIKTTQDNLLIGSTCYPKGATVQVAEHTGRRLIEHKVAVAIVNNPGDEPAIETATIPDAPARAAKRV